MRRIISLPEIAKPASSYHHAVVVSEPRDVLCMAGQVGERPDGTISADFREQAEQVWRNIESILSAAAMSIADITKVTSYIVDREHIASYIAVHRNRVGVTLPPWTLLLVAGLAKPAYLLEVDVEAMR